MDYKALQNGSDIRGIGSEGVEGQHVNLTDPQYLPSAAKAKSMEPVR